MEYEAEERPSADETRAWLEVRIASLFLNVVETQVVLEGPRRFRHQPATYSDANTDLTDGVPWVYILGTFCIVCCSVT